MGHEEDREREFEQALARHLRALADGSADAGESANDQTKEAGDAAKVSGVMGECPGAEVLAAFHERMLSREEMNTMKKHVAACSRCQEILAHLEAGDEIQLQAEEEKVLEMREPVLAAGADREERFGRATAPPAVASASPALKAPRDISSGRRAKVLRWVAPAGAIAAGLLIWVVARDNKLKILAPAQNVQVAQERAEDERAAIPQASVPEVNLGNDRVDQFSPVGRNQVRPAEGPGARNLSAEKQSQMLDRLSKDGRAARQATGGLTAGRAARGPHEGI